jgi:hypothetical protein
MTESPEIPQTEPIPGEEPGGPGAPEAPTAPEEGGDESGEESGGE